MNPKPIVPPDRTAAIKVLISKWEQKNRSKKSLPPVQTVPGIHATDKENKRL